MTDYAKPCRWSESMICPSPKECWRTCQHKDQAFNIEKKRTESYQNQPPMQSDPSNRRRPFSGEVRKLMFEAIDNYNCMEECDCNDVCKFKFDASVKCAEIVQSLPPSGEEETAVGWISVKDRLPEHEKGVSKKVLTYSKYGYRDVHDFYLNGWYKDGEEETDTGITHWMPLPAPPAI